MNQTTIQKARQKNSPKRSAQLSQRFQQRSLRKAVVESVFSPTLFDFWASHLDPSWSWNRPLARVVAKVLVAKDTVTLTLKPNRHVQPFLPGQHVNIIAEIDGVRLTRSYSPSHEPKQAGLFTLTVKRMAGGKVSQWLLDQAGVGDVIEVGTAFGAMTLSDQQAKHTFLAAGSGITPFISLVRHWAEKGAKGELTLIYWAQTRADLCNVAEFNQLAATHPHFKIHYALTQDDSIQTHELGERINQRAIDDLIPDLDAQIVYACGPAGFVEQARELTEAQAQGFYGEAFSLPLLEESDGAHITVQLTRSNRSISIPVGQPILAALEAQGFKPASGCRMGICNTCACIKQAGTTEHVLTQDRHSEAGDSVRICVSRACSDLTLDL